MKASSCWIKQKDVGCGWLHILGKGAMQSITGKKQTSEGENFSKKKKKIREI